MTIYSHSRLETFRNCPLKYKFHYIDKIKRKEEGIEAFLGSRFHEVMEKIYRNLSFRMYSLDELLDFYGDIWDKKYHDKVMIANKERKAKDYKEIGRKFIEDYYKRYHPFNRGKVLGIERPVMIDLDGKGKYRLRGFIDRLNRAEDGTYEIHDYKTSKSLPEQSQMDEDRQLALYQIGVQKLWDDVNQVELVWHYVAFDKEIRSKRTKETLEALKKESIDLIKKIEATREFLPNESTLCGWCYYKDICPLFKHEYMVKNLPENKYLKDNGVQLVFEFAELTDKKKDYTEKMEKVDKELDKIKEAVIKYAENLGVEVVMGSKHKLKITSSEKMNVPTKGSKERESLIELLSLLNKLEEVSTFDAVELKKVMKEKKWDSAILDKIKKFVEVKTVKSVRLLKS